MYAQKLFNNDGIDGTLSPLPLTPLLQNPTGITHLIIAMLHLYQTNNPGPIILNDFAPDDACFEQLHIEIKAFQAAGVKVLCCMGGYTTGSYNRALEYSWDTYYPLLKTFITDFGLDGLDIDIEEPVDQSTVKRLITSLKQDFGASFIVTMTPVASALSPSGGQPGGATTDYTALEQELGDDIAWYNTQFYNGFGDIVTTDDYDAIVANGFPANKVVTLLSTNPQNAEPFYPKGELQLYLKALKAKYPNFGGAGGWEYYNAEVTETGSGSPPWVWLQDVNEALTS